jgi:hypothetical protein
MTTIDKSYADAVRELFNAMDNCRMDDDGETIICDQYASGNESRCLFFPAYKTNILTGKIRPLIELRSNATHPCNQIVVTGKTIKYHTGESEGATDRLVLQKNPSIKDIQTASKKIKEHRVWCMESGCIAIATPKPCSCRKHALGSVLFCTKHKLKSTECKGVILCAVDGCTKYAVAMKYVTSGNSNDHNRSKGNSDNGTTCVTKLVCTYHTPHISDEDRTVPRLLSEIQQFVLQSWADGVGAFKAYTDRHWVEILSSDTDGIFEGTSDGAILYIDIENSPEQSIFDVSRGHTEYIRWAKEGCVTNANERIRVAGVIGTIETLWMRNNSKEPWDVKIEDVLPHNTESFVKGRRYYDRYMEKHPDRVLRIKNMKKVSNDMLTYAFR